MKKNALSIIEIILVITITVMLVGMSLLYYQSSQIRADLDTQVATFISYSRLAQSNAIAGKNSSNHGIHLENDSYTLFSGAIFNPLDSQNFIIELPTSIRIENINVGGADIIFQSPDGKTTNAGTFNFVTQTRTIQVTISTIGNIDYE